MEEDIVNCVIDELHILADLPVCEETASMKTLLTVQVRTIFEEYDNYCAHGESEWVGDSYQIKDFTSVYQLGRAGRDIEEGETQYTLLTEPLI